MCFAKPNRVNVLLENVIQDLNLDHEIILQTHVTNPLLTLETIEKCIAQFVEKEKRSK